MKWKIFQTVHRSGKDRDLTFKFRPDISGGCESQFESFLLQAPYTRNEVSTQEWQGTFRADSNNGAYADDDIADVFTQRITAPFHIYRNVFIPNGLHLLLATN